MMAQQFEKGTMTVLREILAEVSTRGVDFDEVEIAVAGHAGKKTLHTVASGKKCRVTELTIRHAGTNNTVVSLLQDDTVKLSVDVPAQTTRQWESVIGRIFDSAKAVIVRSSDVTGGSTYVSGSGIEA